MKCGAKPSFLGYAGFPGSACVSINSEIIHGIPSRKRILEEGDLVKVDVGALYRGYHGDSAKTFAVGRVSPEAERLIERTRECFYRGVAKAVAGNRIGDVGHAVQTCAEEAGFSVVRELEGHGVGKQMHEDPGIPNYGRKGHGARLVDGMTICIEPMICAGGRGVYLARNGWAVHTADHKNAAHYELTVVVRKGRAQQLSTFDYIEKDGSIKF